MKLCDLLQVFPLLQEVDDELLRKKVVSTLLEAIHMGGWTDEDTGDTPDSVAQYGQVSV